MSSIKPNGIADLSSQQLLDAQAHIWNHIFSYLKSMSLKCAIQLGIPDIIHNHAGPMTLDQLVNALAVNASKSHSLYRVMRILTHSGFFAIDQDNEGYSLAPASLLLLRDEPSSVRPFALAMLDLVLVGPSHRVSEWFLDQSDHDDASSSPFVTTHGMTIFEWGGSNERWNGLFNEGMASDARLVASLLVKECGRVLEGLGSVVDVAGGTGTVAKAIAEAFPGIKCVVLELAHVVAGLEGTHNLSFVAGDMFHSIPHADAVFLKWILHDWTDEDCVKLLKKCKEAISSTKNNGRKVIIVEMVVNDQKEDHKATETQFLFDMLMMNATPGGKERTEKDWAKLFLAAGFTSYKITPLLGLRSVIEVFP